ncbi:MAG: metallophosphoesterase [Bauldia sp.]|nr:metallophosphoesterase [Bauldia sp.]
MFTLVQLSDPHLGPLPAVRWHELVSKRVFGYVNWHRSRSAALGPRTLRHLVADILARPRDHIAVTGDLINIGLRAEIETARIWLDSLGDPEDVSAIPGNHDAYLPGAIRHFEHTWRPYMVGDDHDVAPVVFPFVRRRGPVAIVGVSTAIATAPLMATGRIDQPQADRLEEELANLGEEGLFRIVLIHHPPVDGTTPWHRRLIGAERFRAAVARSGAELVLHGHNHHTMVNHIDGPAGQVPVVGAGSASLSPHHGRSGSSYLVFRIDRTERGFTCDMEERGAHSSHDEVESLREERLVGPEVQPAGTRIQA